MDNLRPVGLEAGPGRSDPIVRVVYLDMAGRKRFGLWSHLHGDEGQLKTFEELVSEDSARMRITPAGRKELGKYTQNKEG